MRLARKLTMGLVVGILVVVGAFDYRLVEDDVQSLEQQLSDHLAVMARDLAVALPDLARVSGPQGVDRLIAERNDDRLAHVRWIRLDARPGDSQWAGLHSQQVAVLESGQELRLVRGRRTHEERLIVYRPFVGQQPARDVVEVSESLAPLRHQERRSLIAVLVKSLLIVLVASVYVLALGVHFIGRPIHRLVEQARGVGAGDLSLRLAFAHRHDEVTELGAEMNQMCDRLLQTRDQLALESTAKIAALDQLRHADRLKTVGQLASGIAHELGTPLNVVSGHAKMIACGATNGEEAHSAARIIVEQAARMAAIIRQLLDFARRSPPALTKSDLGELAGRTLRMLAQLGMQRHVALQLEPPRVPTPVIMDDGQIQQAITNVVVNAIQAMPQGGEIRVDVERERIQPSPGHSASADEYVCLRVRDHGAGMTPEVLAHVFEPFFTTKPVGDGTGLGLSVAYGIVAEHGGWIAASSEIGKGSCFSIYLPAARA